jgi:hypothetical protein
MPTVTSANREEFNEKEMVKKGLLKKEKPVDEQFERVKNHPKYAMLKAKMGKKGAMDAILKQLNNAQ